MLREEGVCFAATLTEVRKGVEEELAVVVFVEDEGIGAGEE